MKQVNNYRPDIDGLRTLAVLAVIVYHLKESWLHGGFLGVDIFLVISGFIMTRMIISDNFSLISFYTSRVRRILPAFLFVVLLSLVFAFLLYSQAEYEKYIPSLKNTLLFVVNNYFSSNEIKYGEISFYDPLMHTWSLSLEMQYYVIYSIILVIFTYITKHLLPITLKFSNKEINIKRLEVIYVLVILFLLSLFASEYLLSKKLDKQAFYLLYPRIWEFVAGGIIAILGEKAFGFQKDNLTESYLLYTRHLSSTLGIIGVALIAISFITINYATSLGIKSLAVISGSALVILAGYIDKNNLVSKVLSTKLMVFIGLISYSLYLWHWPIIAFVKTIYNDKVANQYLILIALISFPLAYLTYKYIEQPFRKSDFILYKKFGFFVNKIINRLKFQPEKVLLFNRYIPLLFVLIFIALIYTSVIFIGSINPSLRGIDTSIKFDYYDECFANNIIKDEEKIKNLEKELESLNQDCLYKGKDGTKNNIEALVLGNSVSSYNTGQLIKQFLKDNDISYLKMFVNYLVKPNLHYAEIKKISESNNIKVIFFTIPKSYFIQANLQDLFKNIKPNIKIVFILTETLSNEPRSCITLPKLRTKLNNLDCYALFENPKIDELKKQMTEKYQFLDFDIRPYVSIELVKRKEINWSYQNVNHLNKYGADLLKQRALEDFSKAVLEYMKK